MKTYRIANVVLIVALNLVGIAAAQAEDFNFTVRVSLSNLLPEVTGGRVSCVVLPGPPSQTAGASRIGDGRSSPFSIDSASGRFSRDITVSFNAYRDKNPSDATYYGCVLHLIGPGGREAEVAAGRPEVWARTKPDTPPAVTEGKLP